MAEPIVPPLERQSVPRRSTPAELEQLLSAAARTGALSPEEVAQARGVRRPVDLPPVPVLGEQDPSNPGMISRRFMQQQADFVMQTALEYAQGEFPDADPMQIQEIAADVQEHLKVFLRRPTGVHGPVGGVEVPEFDDPDDPTRQTGGVDPIEVGPAGDFDLGRAIASHAETLGGVGGSTLPAILMKVPNPYVKAAAIPLSFILGAAGAGAGRGIEDLYGDDPLPEDTSIEERGERMTKAATLELLLSGAFALGPGKVARWMRGDRAVAREVTEIMTRAGMAPALQDVSTSSMVSGSRRILGSFPLLSGPFLKRLRKGETQLRGRMDTFLEDISPDTLIMRRYAAQNDPAMAAAVQEAMADNAFRGISKGYDVMSQMSRQANERLKTEIRNAHRAQPLFSQMQSTSFRLNGLINRFWDNEYMTAAGRIADDIPQEMKDTIKFVTDLGTSRPNRSLQELIAMKRKIRLQIEKTEGSEAADILVELKRGVEEDIDVLLRRGPQSLRDAYEESIQFTSEFVTMVGELIGRRARGASTRLGRQRLQDVQSSGGNTLFRDAGTKDPVMILDELARSSSPREMRQFSELLNKALGPQGARKAIGDTLGRKISRAFDAAVAEAKDRAGDPTFDATKFLRELGLDSTSNKQYAATTALFESIGMNAQRATDLGHVMAALYSVKNPILSQFVQRRGILGGLKSILTGVTGGLIGAGGASQGALLPAAAFLLLGRSWGKWVTDPRRAKLVMAVADSHRPENVRAKAMVSLLTDVELWKDVGSTLASPEEQQQVDLLREQAVARLRSKEGYKSYFQNLDQHLDYTPQRNR